MINKWINKTLFGRQGGEERRDEPNVDQTFTKDVGQDIQTFQELLHETDDLVVRRFEMWDTRKKGAVLFLEGLEDHAFISEYVVHPLLRMGREGAQYARTMDWYGERITATDTTVVLEFSEAIHLLLQGNSIVLIDGVKGCLAAETKGWQQRGIEEPLVESTSRGPREGFVETLRTNRSMVRRRIHHPGLTFEQLALGAVTKTIVNIGYIEGIVRPELVREIQTRIKEVDIDSILESGYLEQLLEDNPFSPFPSLQVTERPDVVCAALLEGRVVIMIDGTPFCLLAPSTINAMMQASDDYYERYPQAILIRIVRWLSLLIGLVLPAFYVSVTTFNHELIPTRLLFTIAATREALPFPAVIEALFMDVAFEILREAGLRLPHIIGSAISIVGVLVIGEAAVSAGLVSHIMVVVVGMTALATFTIPQYSLANAIRFLRFPLIVLSGVFGLFGISIALIAILTHLIKLKSFNISMLDPFVPLRQGIVNDGLIRLPWWMQLFRPWRQVQKDAVQRQGSAGPPRNTQQAADELEQQVGRGAGSGSAANPGSTGNTGSNKKRKKTIRKLGGRQGDDRQ